jgi:pyruvate dehydrogenase E2 component (dihydrolipoamide acetyltransferase)
VKRGQPLVEIETDKANMTYEADSDGVLLEVLAKEGDTLPIGEPIARVGQAGEAVGGDGDSSAGAGEAGAEAPEADGEVSATEAAVAAPRQEAPERARDPSPADVNGGGRTKASPVARRVASELGVELARLEGSGPGGRILKADVEAAARGGAASEAPERGREAQPDGDRAPVGQQAAAPAASPAPEPGAKGEVTVQELSRIQRTVSRRMAESKATVPDFSLELDVDMTHCIELRERLKEQVERAPSFNDMVVKAAASALRQHPRVNGAYRDGRLELYSRVNVGVAVAAADALVVPVIPDADQKSLGEISRQTRRLIERVRDGEITPPELSGGTFTVSNLGMYGIERFTAIINTPQAAILTVGALEKKPAVDDRGRVVARDLMTLTLVCDHRILYGADGAEFLARVRELLERPLSLLAM